MVLKLMVALKVLWITMFYPENPKLEAKNIKFAMNELKKMISQK